MSDISLEIRHSWQEDAELLDVRLMEPRQRCGLACLEMVIKYYSKQDITATEIFERAEKYKAINQHNDWWHPGQVDVLASYGLTAWRRNWTAPTQDPAHFVDNEGYSTGQLTAVSDQINSEREILSVPERFLRAITTSLDSGNPIIVSVKTGFSDNKENHQVVISGRRTHDMSYEIHDPVRKSGPDVIDESYLLKYINYWAIFANKPSG